MAICWGCVLALLTDQRRGFALLWPVLGRRWSAPLVLALTLIALSVFPIDRTEVAAHFLFAALVGSCVLREDNLLAPLLQQRAVVHLGAVSYGMYLMHGMGFNLAAVAGSKLSPAWDAHGPAGFVITLGLTIAAASVSFRFYESYFLRMKSRFGTSAEKGSRNRDMPRLGAQAG